MSNNSMSGLTRDDVPPRPANCRRSAYRAAMHGSHETGNSTTVWVRRNQDAPICPCRADKDAFACLP